MPVLLAIGEQILSDMLRKPLIEKGFDVSSDEVLHRNYLNELVDIQKPSIVILHDLYLPSDHSNSEQRDVEVLELIEQWRLKYNNELRVVYLCVRDKKDPFLAQLVARNVLDIFCERGLDLEKFTTQLIELPKFSNVARFGTGNLDIKFEEENRDTTADNDVLEAATDLINPKYEEVKPNKFAQLQAGAMNIKEMAQKRAIEKAEAKAKAPKKENKANSNLNDGIDEHLFDEVVLDIMPVPAPRATIIGTVLIAVASVTSHLGSTFTAINIASYLKDKGYSVALVESNYSQDFDRIHALYEGEKKLLLKDKQFEMRDLTHFKYREDQNLNDIYSMYEYVVMDFGDLEEAANREDFKRAHVKCVMCSADEWKFHWLKDFTNRHEVDNTYCFIVPGSSSEKAQDLQEQLEYGSVFSYPIQDDPYEPVKDCESVITKILGEFIKSPTLSASKSKLALIGTSVGSILVTIFINYGFQIFRLTRRYGRWVFV